MNKKMILILLGMMSVFISAVVEASEMNLSEESYPIGIEDTDDLVDAIIARERNGKMMINGNEVEGEYTVVQGVAADRSVIWEIQTEMTPRAEVSAFTGIGMHGDTYYYAHNGAVYAISKNNGSRIWKNSDCGNVTGYAWGDDGTIYLCSYMSAPAFAAIDQMGNTLHTINQFGDVYWPYKIEYKSGDEKVEITFESTEPESVYIINLKDYSYYQENEKSYLYCRASEYATLREWSSTSANALARVLSREAVEYLGVDGDFYYVAYNGMKGYVLQEYFSSDRNASLNYGSGSSSGTSSSTIYCRASEFATLRASASVDSTALAKVKSREAVTYLGESGDFYYVSFNGAKGYVLKNYFSFDPNAELNYGMS